MHVFLRKYTHQYMEHRVNFIFVMYVCVCVCVGGGGGGHARDLKRMIYYIATLSDV